MKISHIKLRSSFCLFLYLVSGAVFAKPVAQVIEVKGEVFAVFVDGKTKTLKANDHLEEKSEVMVGEGASITINDYYDATYHLIEGSHLKFLNKSVQLKKGKTWIQAQNPKHSLSLTTANGHVDYQQSEFIAFFDQSSAKTQVLVVKGEVEISNILNVSLKHTIMSGTFSVIDPEYENGIPRTPTRVGLNSLNTALAEFKSLPEKLQVRPPAPSDSPERSIASSEGPSTKPKRGQILFMTNGELLKRRPASAEMSAHQYLKKKNSLSKQKSLGAPIYFYGIGKVPEEKKINVKTTSSPRVPASLVPASQKIEATKKVESELYIDREFTNSLRKQQELQPKHPKELESLIQDLRSY